MPDPSSKAGLSGRILSHPPGEPAAGVLPAGSGPGGRLRVVLADDHAIVREGVAALLRPHAAIVASTGNAEDCVRAVLREEPDLVVFDNLMCGLNGIEVVRRVSARRPRTRLLCLSSRDDAPSVQAAFDAGVHGYLTKRGSFAHLVQAIDRVFRCGCYVPHEMAHVLVQGFRTRHGLPPSDGQTLTAREREVVRLYAEGLKTREIADTLHVSMKTVGTHREHAMEKLGLRGIAQLTRYAIREGLISVDD
ncbi:response regulator transcription factor [Luteibacter flocculans]|uniref:Response regulator transcription factor n=1 Tax=Luteibacter flocculans TaxID=2780091 RepID=A0ABY4SZP7_9GAMM|nr:response regulator transcription factor [Luteibacter flocculans]URL58173.1 response regulator transcription factor [Luteibacter flocculans]